MKPSHCRICEQRFRHNPLDQAEARHQAAKYGPDEAERWFNEKYAWVHEDDRHDDALSAAPPGSAEGAAAEGADDE